MADRTSLLWCGAVGNHLRSWDIDTAGEAKIGAPEMAPYHDGVFVLARIESPTADHLALELRGLVSLLKEPLRKIEFDNPDGPVIQELSLLRRTLDTVLEVPLRDRAGRVDLPGHPISIEVVVTGS